MGQLQWRLWLMGAATFLLGNASGTASSSHSLLHFRHALLLEEKPQFVEVTYLDSQPIQRYDSNTKTMKPLTLWINQTLDEEYWEMETFFMLISEDYFLKNMQDLLVPQKHNQSKDYTFQCIEGCKLTADGVEIEIHQHAIDGKEMKGKKFHAKRLYVDGNCIRWLNRYLDMKTQRTVLPIVKVTHQEVNINNLQALTCQVYGFYPKEISASWRKDGEIFNQTNSSLHIAPNSDGTFNARLSIQINPKERKLYRCHVEHVSSSEPLDFDLQVTGPSAEVTTHVLNVNDTLLNCSICNFYPKEIDATWTQDGDKWDQGVCRGDTTRNWDGTYCTWISIEIDPLEEYRYRCYIEHDGLSDVFTIGVPTVVPQTEENFQPLHILCSAVSVLGILFLLSIVIGIFCYKKRRRDNRAATKLHVWQRLYGCELAEDGSESGYDLYAYDGKDFLSFNKATLNWTAANAEAEVTKKKWDADLDRGWRKKIYLEGECFAWLKKYLDYGTETRARKKPPVVTMSSRTEVDGMESLLCRAHGFYPKEIDAFWRRDGEVWLEDTLQGSVAPNSDGTYHYWLSIRIDPKERSHYRCHVEHDGLQEPLDIPMEEAVSTGVYFRRGGGMVIAVISLVVFIGCIVYCVKKKAKDEEEESTTSDDDLEEVKDNR